MKKVDKTEAQTDQETAEKMAEGKKSTVKAAKQAKKNALKKAADKIVQDMAVAMPGAGQAKSFLRVDTEITELEEKRQAINLALRGKRGELKDMKIVLADYDAVRKLRKMEPEDRKAHLAGVANYSEQLGMELTPAQKKLVDEGKARRETARGITLGAAGDTGAEVGSNKVSASDPEALKELQERSHTATGNMGGKIVDGNPIPPKNDAVGQAHRAPAAARH